MFESLPQRNDVLPQNCQIHCNVQVYTAKYLAPPQRMDIAPQSGWIHRRVAEGTAESVALPQNWEMHRNVPGSAATSWGKREDSAC